MSAIRKISLSVAALFLGLSALFVVGGTAVAASNTTTTVAVECEDDWNTPPCP